MIAVVSAKAIGAPLSEDVAHRVERVQEITGAAAGERLTPEHVARTLASERGALKDVGDAAVVPVINMVDDTEREELAREAAQIALQMSDRFERVVLTSTRRSEYVVDVVRGGR